MRAWFKFFGRDFRDGVRGVLTLEEAGAYTIVLSLIYETENRLLDDERIICAHLNVDARVWRRIRRRLLEVGKLVLEDGLLTNARATSELSSALLVSEVRRKSGRSGGEQSGKSRAKPLQTKEAPEANASISLPYARAFQNTEADISSSLRSEDMPAKPKRASRPKREIPADLPMTDQARAFAAERGFVNGTGDELWLAFTSWHAANKKTSADFEASWRTWVLNQVKFRGEQHGNRFGSAGANGAGHGSRTRGQPRSAASIILESAAADALEPDPAGSLFGRDDDQREPAGDGVPRRVGGVGAG